MRHCSQHRLEALRQSHRCAACMRCARLTRTESIGVDSEPLLERSEQLAALKSELDAVAASGRGRLVLVAGEAGIGKTALVRRLLRRARASTSSVAPATRCSLPARSARSSTSATSSAGSSRPSWSGRRDPERPGRGARGRAAPERRDDRRARGPALGRRRDARRPAAARVADAMPSPHSCSRPTATTSSIARIRCGSCSASCRGPARDQAAARAAVRLRRSPVSPARTDVDPGDLHRRTAGNPFFVTRGARRRRHARCPTTRSRRRAGARGAPADAARALLDAVADRAAAGRAVAARGADRPATLDELDDCLDSGMLRASATPSRSVTRSPAEPSRRRSRRDRRAGASPPGAGGADRTAARQAPDPARLAHHAEAAGDAERCCATRRPPASRRPRSAPIARRPRSSRARCASPTGCRARSGPSCSSAAPTSAT